VRSVHRAGRAGRAPNPPVHCRRGRSISHRPALPGGGWRPAPVARAPPGRAGTGPERESGWAAPRSQPRILHRRAAPPGLLPTAAMAHPGQARTGPSARRTDDSSRPSQASRRANASASPPAAASHHARRRVRTRSSSASAGIKSGPSRSEIEVARATTSRSQSAHGRVPLPV
jgi:hypothetical protein